MFVIVRQENHPDRFVSDEGYGPYDTWEEANTAAEEAHAASFRKLWRYIVVEIVNV